MKNKRVFDALKLKRFFAYFSFAEKVIWISSVLLIFVSFVLFSKDTYITFVASVFGVTGLLFCAKGNLFGPIILIVFCLIYGYISFSFSYYGEMITYMGMSLPMAIASLISWYKHPFKGKRTEVQINTIQNKEYIFLIVATSLVTALFYFILAELETAYIIPSTISISTSFVVVYLTFRRSPFYALGYAVNDLVLIALWALASIQDSAYISVVVCFITFFVNDIYGFISWSKIKKRQSAIIDSQSKH